jgi:hypothetical protein
MPESLRECLAGFAGSSGNGGISMTVVVTSDFEDAEPDLRGFGRTMASWGEEELFSCTILTIGCPPLPTREIFDVSEMFEADFELPNFFARALGSFCLCFLCFAASLCCSSEYAEADMRTDNWLSVSNASCREISDTLVRYL